jgi:hypothetical protein
MCMNDVACGFTVYSVLVQGVMQLYVSKVADVKLAGKVSVIIYACGY